jgi:rod shape determining protein RodA
VFADRGCRSGLLIGEVPVEIRAWRHFDFLMMLATAALGVYGLLMIYSATLGIDGSGFDSRVFRQGIYLVVGIGLLLVLAATDYHFVGSLAWLAYGGCVILLIAVPLLGHEAFGSQRSIPLGVIDLQPSEPMKLVLAVTLARFISQNSESIRSSRVFYGSFAIALLPVCLTLIQPDLGTSLVLLAIWAGVAFVAGGRLIHFGSLGLLGALASPLLWRVMPDYQKERIFVFLDGPWKYLTGEGYNVVQALISVGSGGLTGRGYASGTQSQLHFLRVKYADFIFAVVGEELGFIGSVLLVGLLLFLLMRGLRAASIARDDFGRLLCIGVVSGLAFQSLVNIAVNLNFSPVTGVPLPLISYGGSSAMTVLASIGILQSVAMRHKRFEF